MKKLHSSRGETLLESLISIGILACILLALATAVETAARVNDQLRQTGTYFHYAPAEAQGQEVSIRVIGEATTGTYSVWEYLAVGEENGMEKTYRYYQMQPREQSHE